MKLITRRSALAAVKFAISIGLLVLIVRGNDLRKLQTDLLAVDHLMFFLAVLLLFLQTFVLSGRWVLILHAIGVSLGWLAGWRITVISSWFNQVLPSGGELARVWMLRRRGASWAITVKSVLADRFTALLGLIALMLGGLPFLFMRFSDFSILVPIAGIVAAGLVGTAALATIHRWPSRIVAIPYLRSFIRFGILVRFLLFAAPEREVLFGSAIFVHLLTTAACYVLAAGLQQRLPALDALILVPPVILLSAIPISIGGWGVRESAMVASLALADITPDKALAVSVLLGLANALVGLAGAVVWLIAPERGYATRQDLVIEEAPPTSPTKQREWHK